MLDLTFAVSALKTEAIKFRRLAQDLREARMLPANERWELCGNFTAQANYLLCIVFLGDFLAGLRAVMDKRNVEGNSGGLYDFTSLVGYTTVKEYESRKPPFGVEYQQTEKSYYIACGPISLAYPEFDSISVSDPIVTGGGLDQNATLRKYSFEIFGNYSHACNIIADLLDEEAKKYCAERPNDLANLMNNVGPNSVPTDALDLARQWLEKPRKLGGPTEPQRNFIEQLFTHNGYARHADISTGGQFYWENPRKGATNMADRINKSIADTEQWTIIKEDNSGCRIVLRSALEKRS